MHRLALAILGLLAGGLVFPAVVQGTAPPDCTGGAVVRHVREAPPSVPDQWTRPLLLSALAECPEGASDDAGPAPFSSAATLPAAVQAGRAVLASRSVDQTRARVQPLYHVYCVLLL